MDTPENSNDASEDIYSILPSSMPLAYVRPVVTASGKSYAVCTADGQQLALFDTQDAAFFAAKQHELEVVLIH